MDGPGAEEFFIRNLVPPLNITHRKAHPYSRHLMNLKRELPDAPSNSVPSVSGSWGNAPLITA